MKDDKKQIGNDAVKVTIAKIIAQALSMVVAMLMARFLTLEENGTYSQVILVINMVLSLFMLGLPNSMNYYMGRAENKEQKKQFLSTYYALNTLLGLGVGVILLVCMPLVMKYFDNQALKSLWFFMLLYPWGKIITTSAENLYIVYHKTNSVLLYRVLLSGAIIVAIIIAHIIKLNFNMYMLILLVITLVFSAVVLLEANKLGEGICVKLSFGYIKQVLAFSLPLGLATAVGTINIELDKFMVGNFVDTATHAVYTNASKEMPVAIVASAFTAVLLPRFSKYFKENQKDKVVQLWGHSTKIAFYIICFLSIGMFVFAPDCIRVLYSEKFISGSNIFRVYCLVLLLRTTYFGLVLNAAGKTKFIFYSALASLGINFVLNYLLYIPLGLIGPALATLISQIIINGFQIVYSAKLLNIKVSKLFPWKGIGVIFLINVILGICFFFIKKYLVLENLIGTEMESIVLALVWLCVDFLVFKKSAFKEWHSFNNV